MGWTEYHATHWKNGKIDRKAECDSLFEDERLEILKSAMVGSVHYAAIRNNLTNDVFATITLTSTDMRHYYNFAYKDMDETCGPHECKCPMSILNLLTPTENEWANQWRESCKEYNLSLKHKNLGSLRVGSLIEFTANDVIYRAVKLYGKVTLHRDGDNVTVTKMQTYWKPSNHPYLKVTSKVINSWGYEVLYSATKEDEERLRKERLLNIHGVRC